MDLRTLIQERLDNQDVKRKHISEQELDNCGSGYNVQYLPCGHSREILRGEKVLLRKATEQETHFLSALILDSVTCPECEHIEYMSDHSIR